MSDEKKQDIGFEIFKALGEAMFSGKHSKRKVLDIYRLADKTQPKAGWDKVGGKLMHRYEQQGADLDSP